MKTVSILAVLALAAPALAAPAGGPQVERRDYPHHHKKPIYPTSSSCTSGAAQGTGYTPKSTGSWVATPSGSQASTYEASSTYQTYEASKTYGSSVPTTNAGSSEYTASPYQTPSAQSGSPASKKKCTKKHKSTAGAGNTYSTQGGNTYSTQGGNTYSAGSTATASTSTPSSTSTTSSGSSNNTTSSGASGLGIPSGCLSKGGVSVGWLPDQDAGVKMPAITGPLGSKACFYGLYSQIKGSTYDDSQLTANMDDIKSSGAVFQPAVMPTGVSFSEITEDLAAQIAASMKKFTDEGITVWLRFAHEVNWYVTDGTYKGGSAAEFVQAWRNVANACKSNDKVKMYWSPNSAAPSDLQSWFPGKEYVDVTGIDIYPSDDKVGSLKAVYGAFYDAFSGKYGIPFAVGETAAGGEASQDSWLKSLVGGDESMPEYVGFSWFEYDKEKDWRVVTGGSGDIAKAIL